LQRFIGLAMLPLSLIPFIVYFGGTPEGRLLWTRAKVQLFPPTLPKITPTEARRDAQFAPRYTGGVAALVYHGIGSSTDAEGRYSLSVERFGEQLDALRAAGMHFVTARELALDYRNHRVPPANAVMLTFDDGRAEAMMLADPLLRAAHARATMFVITGRAEDHGLFYASTGALRGYAHDGAWDLESHTDAEHVMQETKGGRLPRLTSLANGETLSAYRSRIATDLDQADRVLTRLTGARPVAFAYPFGAYGADRTNDPAIRASLKNLIAHRYALSFQQDDQPTLPLVTCADARTTLRRLDVLPWTGTQLLTRIKQMVHDTRFASRCAATK
jgi:peptidoglycan/xylan/chitin deacetylase (PgdA/CDA1 family)